MKKFLIFLVVGVLAIGIGTSIKVRANPLADYEVIERINYVDDNWEFAWLPSFNDNWNEYGLRFNLELSNYIYSGITYFSSISEIIEGSQIYLLSCDYTYSLISNIISISISLQVGDGINALGLVRLYTVADNITYLYTPDTIENGWIELIHIVSDEPSYEEGYNTGYAEGISQNFSSFGSFLTNSVGGFLNFEIFPGFSLMNILWAMLGILLFVIILKVFAGG